MARLTSRTISKIALSVLRMLMIVAHASPRTAVALRDQRLYVHTIALHCLQVLHEVGKPLHRSLRGMQPCNAKNLVRLTTVIDSSAYRSLQSKPFSRRSRRV